MKGKRLIHCCLLEAAKMEEPALSRWRTPAEEEASRLTPATLLSPVCFPRYGVDGVGRGAGGVGGGEGIEVKEDS